MTVYIVLIFVILILGLGIKPRRSRQRRKIFLILSFLLMTTISGFRDFSVGVDTISYVYMFNNIDMINFFTSRYELGFLYFLKIIRSFTENPTVFLLLSSAICIGVTCRFIFKYSDDPILSVLLYITLKPFFFQMTGIRQAIAMAFVMIAFMLIMEQHKVRETVVAIVFMILAVQFHGMSIVAFVPFVIWLFSRLRDAIRITPNSIVKRTLIAAVVAFIAYPYIMRLVGLITPQYAYYFSGIWGESNYLASLFKMLIQLVFLVVGSIYLRNLEVTEIEKFALINIFISVIIDTLSMRMEIWGRLTGMFSIYTGILFAPLFTSEVNGSKNRIILKSSVFMFSFLYMLVTFIFRPEWDGVVPYLFK